MRFFASLLIALSLSISPSTHAGVALVDLKELVTAYNSPKTKESLLQTHPQIQKSLRAHGLMNEKLPAADLIDDEIVFREYPDYKFKFTPQGELQVRLKEKSVELKSWMTFEEMRLSLESLGSVPKKFSFMRFFLDEANAGAGGIAILVVAALAFYKIYGTAITSKLKVKSAVDLRNCQMAENDGTSMSKANAVEAYNQLSTSYSSICLHGSSLFSKGYSKEACENISKAKLCYKQFVMNDGADVETDRTDSTNKDLFLYDREKDIYHRGSSRQ